MLFECVDDVHYPVEQVYALLRDEMTLIVPYLADVEAIEVVERQEEPGGVRIVNLWRASSRAVPAVVQKFLSPELLSWKDHALWHAGAHHCSWRLEPKIGGHLFECDGQTHVMAGTTEGTARVRIAGDLRVYPERLPGVPKLLAGKLRSKIEGFVVEMLVPNMQTMARGVQSYLDDRART